MLYAIGEILLFLLVAAVLGGLVGWYWRGSRLRASLAAQWSAELAEVQADRDSAQRALSDRDKELAAAQEQWKVEQAARSDAEASAATMNKAKTAAEAKSSKLVKTTAVLTDERDAAASRADEASASLRSSQKQLTALQQELDECRRQASAAPVAGKASAAKPSSSEAAEAARAKVGEIARRTAGDSPQADDDLKRIKGVGPKIEQLLKTMGITSFQQIARFSDDDVAVVATALKAFPDRMLRDDWKGQAASLHAEEHGS